MKLSELIEQADNTYQLGLSVRERNELHRRLVGAGYRGRTVRMSSFVDDVLKTTDSLRTRPALATATTQAYSGMKVETVAANDQCPRCQQPMRRVKLLSDRPADYCQGCAITLPLRA